MPHRARGSHGHSTEMQLKLQGWEMVDAPSNRNFLDRRLIYLHDAASCFTLPLCGDPSPRLARIKRLGGRLEASRAGALLQEILGTTGHHPQSAHEILFFSFFLPFSRLGYLTPGSSVRGLLGSMIIFMLPGCMALLYDQAWELACDKGNGKTGWPQ